MIPLCGKREMHSPSYTSVLEKYAYVNIFGGKHMELYIHCACYLCLGFVLSFPIAWGHALSEVWGNSISVYCA